MPITSEALQHATSGAPETPLHELLTEYLDERAEQRRRVCEAVKLKAYSL